MKCKNCGAVLPESLICDYCGADNSPEFRAKFDDKGMGIIECKCETVECYISEIEIDSVVPDSGTNGYEIFPRLHPASVGDPFHQRETEIWY